MKTPYSPPAHAASASRTPVASAAGQTDSRETLAAEHRKLIVRAALNSFFERTAKDEFDGSFGVAHVVALSDRGEQVKRGFLRDQMVMQVASPELLVPIPAATLHGQILPYNADNQALKHSLGLLLERAVASREAIRSGIDMLPSESPYAPATSRLRETLQAIENGLGLESGRNAASLLTDKPRLSDLLKKAHQQNGILTLVPGRAEPLFILRDITKFYRNVQSRLDEAELVAITYGDVDSKVEEEFNRLRNGLVRQNHEDVLSCASAVENDAK